MADAKTGANSIKAAATTVVADAKAAETVAMSWLDWAMTYVPVKWKKYVGIGAALLALFYFGGSVFDFVWSHIPSRSSVTPATMSDVAEAKSAPTARLNVMSQIVSEMMATNKSMSDNMSDMERRLEALEARKTAKIKKPITE